MNPKIVWLREKANNLSMEPGVYLMLDSDDCIIYVGKAKKLKNRVSSYFRGEHLPKVESMIAKICDFKVIPVKSEFEALVLENSLIKKYQPHYNILLKDDKGYPFVKINLNDDFPRFSIANRIAKDGADYYGPYGGRDLTRNLMQLLSNALKLPDCNKKIPCADSRPCINYHIGKCDGWCKKDASKVEYNKRVLEALKILDGESEELIEELEQEMFAAAENENFEYAAILRDRIKSVKGLNNKERVTSGRTKFEALETEDDTELFNKRIKTLELLKDILKLNSIPSRIEAYDISNLKDFGIVAAMTVFKDGNPLKKEYRKFKIKDIEVQNDYASMFQCLYRRFNRLVDGDEKFSILPDLIIIDGGQTHAKIAKEVLDNFKISVPVFGAVKDDRHKTRALVSPFGDVIDIKATQSVYVLIGKIQEETHRFAIEYQRILRYENFGSELDQIVGVGNSRKSDLLRHFKTVKAIGNATLDELTDIVPSNTAKAIFEHFNGRLDESNNRNG